MKKITVVYNKKSGSALSFAKLKEIFEKYNYSIERSIDISGKNFEKRLKEAASTRRLIAAVGGDGTLSGVANIVAGSPATLLPLPGGTLNNFTKDAGIPQDIEKALARSTQVKPRLIDIASVNDILFLNNSSIGLYPQSLTLRKDLEKSVSKWPAALVASLQAFTRFRTYKVTLDNTQTFHTPFIFIGNNRYQINNFAFTNRTELDEGTLCIYAIKATSRVVFAKLFFAVLRGKLHDADEFSTFSTSSISIETSRKKSISISHDGEVSSLTTPLSYKSRPKTLRILG